MTSTVSLTAPGTTLDQARAVGARGLGGRNVVHQRRRRRWAGACLAAIAVVALAGPAHAGEGPYGPTTTDPPQGGADASCSLSIEVGAPGDTGTATVTQVAAGQLVRVLFGGVEGGRGEAPADAPGGRATVSIAFTVPQLDSGEYLVTAVSTTFTAECSVGFGVTEVAGAIVDRPGDGNIGPLPKTGVYIALLVAVAVALLVVGRSLLAASRRQRRRAWAEANRVELLARPPGPPS